MRNVNTDGTLNNNNAYNGNYAIVPASMDMRDLVSNAENNAPSSKGRLSRLDVL